MKTKRSRVSSEFLVRQVSGGLKVSDMARNGNTGASGGRAARCRRAKGNGTRPGCTAAPNTSHTDELWSSNLITDREPENTRKFGCSESIPVGRRPRYVSAQLKSSPITWSCPDLINQICQFVLNTGKRLQTFDASCDCAAAFEDKKIIESL